MNRVHLTAGRRGVLSARSSAATLIPAPASASQTTSLSEHPRRLADRAMASVVERRIRSVMVVATSGSFGMMSLYQTADP
jgi:hypothetical protein